ncbi:MAG: hypothetical protein A2V90_03765 [Gammaproteobacteria bacterium RBG_16_57_12]|nr:MAG: hypothetical protein A2V90_03765 [Gammaproteobacteria bacterium RBG_16_57_12]
MNAKRTLRFLLPLLIAAFQPTLAQGVDSTPDAAKDQIESLSKRLAQSETNVKSLTRSAKALSQDSKDQSKQIGTLKAELDKLRLNQQTSAQNLSDAMILRFLALLGMLVVVLAVVGFSFLAFRRRLRASESGLGEKYDRAVASIREADQRMAQADANLARELSSLLLRIKEGRQSQSPVSTGNSETQDHSLALRLADEIHRMQKRLNALPEDTKGLGPLKKSIERLEGELADQGYEIVDLTNKSFSDGLNVVARFIPDESLSPDERIISKVIKPQVNYRGTVVQVSELEVSTGS